MPEEFPDGIDWSLTTFEGARREQMRRWRQLRWDEIIAAQEEMAELAEIMRKPAKPSSDSPPAKD
jgi:hypothetical protein